MLGEHIGRLSLFIVVPFLEPHGYQSLWVFKSVDLVNSRTSETNCNCIPVRSGWFYKDHFGHKNATSSFLENCK